MPVRVWEKPEMRRLNAVDAEAAAVAGDDGFTQNS